MSDIKETLKLALEALESLVESHGYTSYISDEEKEAEGEVMFARSTITAIEEILAQPQRTWVGLTDEDKQTAFDDTQEGGGFWEFADAIEAKLKEKNT